MFESESILVTGAGGLIGRAVCMRLSEQGHSVLGIDSDPHVEADVEATGAKFVRADVSDHQALTKLTAGYQRVVHTAAIVSDWGPMNEFIEVNVRGTRNVLDAAAANNVAQVVHISSVAAWGYDYSRPPTDNHWTARQGVPYVDTKAASDDLARRRGAAVVRPGDVYGPGSKPWSIRPLEALKSGRFILPGSGDGLMAPVYIDDLVDLIVIALFDARSRGVALTGFGGQTVTAAEFFGFYSRMLGKERTPTAPRLLATAAALGLELVSRFTGKPPEVSRTAMVFIDRSAGYETSTAQTLLNWHPKVDLEQGMAETEVWFRKTGLLPPGKQS